MKRVETTGMKAEWPGGFIDMATFLAHPLIGIDPSKVKMKSWTIRDPDGVERTGVVLKIEDRSKPAVSQMRGDGSWSANDYVTSQHPNHLAMCGRRLYPPFGGSRI